MYRKEHPKPQFCRKNWQNLNGEWEFQFDHADSGRERELFSPTAAFERVIHVPFCPQSKLSGIGETDFMRAVWYRRHFTLDEKTAAGRVVLHFGAVDYEAYIYVNGTLCGTHRGGYVSFAVDITKAVHTGDNIVTVLARDDERDRRIPSGKQSMELRSSGCFYTRTIGIWQTVWLEFTPHTYIADFTLLPDVTAGALTVQVTLVGCADLTLKAAFAGKTMGEITLPSASDTVTFTLPLAEKHLWEIGKGGLYDLSFGFGDDAVESYFGLRSIAYRDRAFFLNGKSVFQRLVLDQGFYPDGIYTAPDDADLIADIDRSVAMGFNGARLHEKIFEERFLYHCDRKGYIVWGEFPDWGLDPSNRDVLYNTLPEWIEEVRRDRNHPAIVGWCPFNETWDYAGRQRDGSLQELTYEVTKAIDPTRPCLDVSGNYHAGKSDIYDVHCYDQDPKSFAARYATLPQSVDDTCGNHRQQYDGERPFFVSEYGGIRWSNDRNGWGYGDAPKTEEEFLERLKGLTDALLENPYIFGFCYTQLTDVEQEQNGLYTYDRVAKFPPETIAAIFSAPAAIEGKNRD